MGLGEPVASADSPFDLLNSACEIRLAHFDLCRLSGRMVKFVPNRGAVAQLGERLVRNEEASGSIPLSSTKFPSKILAL